MSKNGHAGNLVEGTLKLHVLSIVDSPEVNVRDRIFSEVRFGLSCDARMSANFVSPRGLPLSV